MRACLCLCECVACVYQGVGGSPNADAMAREWVEWSASKETSGPLLSAALWYTLSPLQTHIHTHVSVIFGEIKPSL